ncbi:MAG TPA: hypothetical protein VJL60_03225 [Gammaproteobacteria bacterium]|nr:hypothetical protein [Gammaproteobacteria bacterium]
MPVSLNINKENINKEKPIEPAAVIINPKSKKIDIVESDSDEELSEIEDNDSGDENELTEGSTPSDSDRPNSPLREQGIFNPYQEHLDRIDEIIQKSDTKIEESMDNLRKRFPKDDKLNSPRTPRKR